MGVSQSKDENMEEESQYIPARITLTPQTQGYDSQDRGVGGTWGDDSRTMTGGPEIVDGEVRTTAQAAMQVDENYATSYEDGNRSVTLPGNVGVNDVDDIVPTVFKWENGGRNVYITGTFNNWERQIPMHRSGNEFSYVHNLSRGKHAYKFIVDDEWRFAPDQPTVADVEGRINNFIDVSEFAPYVGDIAFFEKCKDRKVHNSEFKDIIPDLDEYTKEPPSLPPHLRLIILNKLPPTADPMALLEPQHVSLNHLYCTAIKDGMMVLGATQRYRQKYVTVVFYSVMSS